MILQMTLDQLGNQSVQSAAEGGNELQDVFALTVSVKCRLDRFDLTLDPPGSGNHRRFALGRVRQVASRSDIASLFEVKVAQRLHAEQSP
jgi:hypothetical protein